MPLIPVKETEVIRKHLEKHLKGPVVIHYFTQGESEGDLPVQECAYCRETHALVSEVAALSERIELEVHDFVAESETARSFGVERIPALVLSGSARGRVRFFGIPSGYEFATLIEGLVDVSSGKTDLAPQVGQQLEEMQGDVHVQVFVTPT